MGAHLTAGLRGEARRVKATVQSVTQRTEAECAVVKLVLTVH